MTINQMETEIQNIKDSIDESLKKIDTLKEEIELKKEQLKKLDNEYIFNLS